MERLATPARNGAWWGKARPGRAYRLCSARARSARSVVQRSQCSRHAEYTLVRLVGLPTSKLALVRRQLEHATSLRRHRGLGGSGANGEVHSGASPNRYEADRAHRSRDDGPAHHSARTAQRYRAHVGSIARPSSRRRSSSYTQAGRAGGSSIPAELQFAKGGSARAKVALP